LLLHKKDAAEMLGINQRSSLLKLICGWHQKKAQAQPSAVIPAPSNAGSGSLTLGSVAFKRSATIFSFQAMLLSFIQVAVIQVFIFRSGRCPGYRSPCPGAGCPVTGRITGFIFFLLHNCVYQRNKKIIPAKHEDQYSVNC
jgi:hypothetical protein